MIAKLHCKLLGHGLHVEPMHPDDRPALAACKSVLVALPINENFELARTSSGIQVLDSASTVKNDLAKLPNRFR